MIFTKLDFAIDDDGNLSTANGEIARASSTVSLAKAIEWRMKTTRQEWRTRNPFIIAGVPLFIGRPNTEEVADLMRTKISNALTADGLIPPNDLTVDVVPISIDEVQIIIEVRNFNAVDLDSTTDLQFIFNFRFQEGLITSLTGGTR